MLYNQLSNVLLLNKSLDQILKSKPKKKQASSKGCDGISLLEFKKNKEIYLEKLSKDLLEGTYKHDNLFGYALSKEDPSKFRLIACSTIKDRIIHRAILSLIYNKLIPLIDTKVSYCGIKRISNENNEETGEVTEIEIQNTKKAISKLAFHVKHGNFFVFKSDIEKFYDSIPREKMYQKIKKALKVYLSDTSLNKLFRQLIYLYFEISNPERFQNNKLKNLLPKPDIGIPQGSCLSQLLANIYLVTFDLGMQKKFGDRFIRYIDDFIIICKTEGEARSAELEAKRLLKKLQLFLSTNPNKTTIIDLKKGWVNFLGLKISQSSISTKESVKELIIWIKLVLNKNNKEYYNLTSDNEKIEKMNHKIGGKANYIRFYHAHNAIKLINKFIKIAKQQNKKTYSRLKIIDLNLIHPIVNISIWQKYFIRSS